MHLTIDENEQAHIYSCLLVGNQEFAKVKKSLAKLNREDDAIDEEIARNAELRRIFNPRAEDEARERDRKKTDPAQIDLTEAGSSGETGGGTPAGQTFALNTGAPKTVEEIRDALLELGVAVLAIDVDSWSDDERSHVTDYIAGMRQALAEGDDTMAALIDAPECVERDGTTVARLRELLALGPWGVRESIDTDDGTTDYSVCRESSDPGDGLATIDEITDDKLDAEIRAARLNRTELQRADMGDDEILEWSGKGPWLVTVDESGQAYSITAGTQREACESELDAMGRAARYNRSIAARRENEAWANEPQRVAPEPDVEVAASAD